MTDKNLEIIDELMQAIIQTDVWMDEAVNNPEIQASERELGAVMKEIERYAPKELVNRLSDAVAGNVSAHESPAMLYGMRVAYAIGDVSRRPSDLLHFPPLDAADREGNSMSEKTLTLEAVKEQFCVADKQEALEKMRQSLDDAWNIDKATDLAISIGKQMENSLETDGITFTLFERLTWAVKEAFILGSLDMATTMMIVADMSFEALAEECQVSREEGTENE